jgi:Glycosyl hydrolase family 12
VGSELYYGTNTETQQEVFTWLATGNPTSFNADVSGMIKGLQDATGANAPGNNVYFGYAAFGSETFYSGTNVTFSVPRFALSINGD